MDEVWKDVDGYDGYYQVSNFGNVRSFNLSGLSNNQREKAVRIKLQEVRGYLRVGIRSINNRERHYVHRLVAIAFIPNPENKPCVNHKNGIKTDNKVNNLEWVTHRENTAHALENDLTKALRGENVGTSKLTEREVINIRKIARIRGYFYNPDELATRYNVSKRAIKKVVQRKTWRHI